MGCNGHVMGYKGNVVGFEGNIMGYHRNIMININHQNWEMPCFQTNPWDERPMTAGPKISTSFLNSEYICGHLTFLNKPISSSINFFQTLGRMYFDVKERVDLCHPHLSLSLTLRQQGCCHHTGASLTSLLAVSFTPSSRSFGFCIMRHSSRMATPCQWTQRSGERTGLTHHDFLKDNIENFWKEFRYPQ